MKKFTIIFLAAMLILGSFGICNAGGVSSVVKLLSIGSKVSDGYDAFKFASSLMGSDISELNIHGVELGETDIKTVNNQWKFERYENNGKFTNWFYNLDTIIITSNEKGVVTFMACENDYMQTKRGIKVGSALQDVIKAYGSEFVKVQTDEYSDTYIYNIKLEEGLLDKVSNFFSSKEGKVGRIFFNVGKQSQEVLGFAAALIE